MSTLCPDKITIINKRKKNRLGLVVGEIHFETNFGMFSVICPKIVSLSKQLQPKNGKKFGTGLNICVPLHQEQKQINRN
jgi:hypothetical protein